MKLDRARVVLVGACGGIGRAAAPALLDAGASVMLVGRSPARLAAMARTLAARRSIDRAHVAWHPADITRPVAIDALRNKAAEWRADVLVLAAGVPSFGRFEALDEAAVLSTLHTNLVAPIAVTHALLPGLRERAQARVVFVGSALGSIGLPGFSVYSAGKFGLRGFAEALRRELADTNVRVQYLAPRTTRTGFNDADVQAYNRATHTAVDPPEIVARALVALLQGQAGERFIGFPERLAVRLNAMAPTWLDRAFAVHRRSLPGPPASGRPAPAPPATDELDAASPSAPHPQPEDASIPP